MAFSLYAPLALLLGAAAPPAAMPPQETTQPVPTAEAASFKRVTVGFKKIAPLDPVKRAALRQAEPNRTYSPLILETGPEGTRVLRHGPKQQIQYLRPDTEAPGDATEQPQ